MQITEVIIVKKDESYQQNPGDINIAGSKEIPRQTNVTSHNYSVFNTEKVSQYIEEPREHDSIIKRLLDNARFTGFLLTRILPEMKGVTLDQFCEYTNTNADTGGSLTQQATEISSAGIKDVRLDLVFEYAAASRLLLRINEEPQDSQQSYTEENEESYSLIARAVYYASLAMVTGIHSNEEYHKIRKVYSIWICFKRPIPEMRIPIISYSLKPDDDYKYIDGQPLQSNKRKFDNGDLMGIIMISVPDLENAIKKGKDAQNAQNDKYSWETLVDLYNLLSNNISYEERRKFYYNTAIVKEGFEMESSVSTMEYALELQMKNKEIAHNLEMELRNLEIKTHENEEWTRNLELKTRNLELKAHDLNIKEQQLKDREQQEEQIKEQAVVEAIIELGSEIGWSESEIIQKITKKLKITQEKAKSLFNLLIQEK